MYKAIAANKRNTILIMAVFVGLVTAVGWALSALYGNTWMTPWILAGAALYALIQYFIADKLAIAMTGAHEIQKRDNPRLWRIVENLAITNGMPMPRVYIIDDPAPNAFATGRNPDHAIVGATTGILELMDDRELNAVMAHEMGHVRNYDIRVSMIAFGLASLIGVLSDIAMHILWFGGSDNRPSNPIFFVIGLVVVLLAPILAVLIQSAVSRQREYLADATGAMTTRDPDALASALEKLGAYSQPLKRQSTATAHLFFDNPLSPGSLMKLFSTHPPIEKRVARLRNKLTSI